MDAPKKKRERPTKRGAPAKTVEARESQLIGMAIDLAAEQLSAGTASSQIMTHFLKIGTMRAKLEMEKLKQENELLKAKTLLERDTIILDSVELWVETLLVMTAISRRFFIGLLYGRVLEMK